MKKIAETKISDNHSTAVPEAFRVAEEASPGDYIHWYLEDGEWLIDVITDEDS
jgi:hypothetical protein